MQAKAWAEKIGKSYRKQYMKGQKEREESSSEGEGTLEDASNSRLATSVTRHRPSLWKALTNKKGGEEEDKSDDEVDKDSDEDYVP